MLSAQQYSTSVCHCMFHSRIPSKIIALKNLKLCVEFITLLIWYIFHLACFNFDFFFALNTQFSFLKTIFFLKLFFTWLILFFWIFNWSVASVFYAILLLFVSRCLPSKDFSNWMVSQLSYGRNAWPIFIRKCTPSSL